jgi:hypothetical protein
VSLEQLRVVSRDDIHVGGNRVLVYLTPTIPHCSMSTLIGESCGRAGGLRLLATSASSLILPACHADATPQASPSASASSALPSRYRVDIRIKEGTHQSEHAVNKQLNDKERVQAALENSHLLQVVEGCLATAGQRGFDPGAESE